MLPSAITLWNYRSFPGPVRLELRPVTLLFGDNNSGKSALLRALPLLGDSETFPAPLNLRSPAARGSSFQDLLWKGISEDEDRDLGVGYDWVGTDGTKRYECRLAWFEEWKRIIVRHISYWETGMGLALEAVWVPMPEEKTSPDLTYSIKTPENESPILDRLRFLGLTPDSFTLPRSSRSTALPNGVFDLGLAGQVQWLTATRRLESRVQQYLNMPSLNLDPEGWDAPSLLATNPEFLKAVSSWYERNLRRRLRIQDVPPDRFRLMLQHVDRAELDTDLIENGEGTIQILPVLTALALTHQELAPRILAIEEPESHLHPSLQRALAEHICEVAAATPPSRIVLETHSEHILLGVQLAILKGRLSPEDVRVYWVRQLDNGESVADSITLDEYARPQGAWPPGVFAEDTDMAREIIQARRELAKA